MQFITWYALSAKGHFNWWYHRIWPAKIYLNLYPNMKCWVRHCISLSFICPQIRVLCNFWYEIIKAIKQYRGISKTSIFSAKIQRDMIRRQGNDISIVGISKHHYAAVGRRANHWSCRFTTSEVRPAHRRLQLRYLLRRRPRPSLKYTSDCRAKLSR